MLLKTLGVIACAMAAAMIIYSFLIVLKFHPETLGYLVGTIMAGIWTAAAIKYLRSKS